MFAGILDNPVYDTCAEELITPSVLSFNFIPLVKCAELVSNVSVRVAAIVPPPLNPEPALILTVVWSICSLPTKFVVASWSICTEPETVFVGKNALT